MGSSSSKQSRKANSRNHYGDEQPRNKVFPSDYDRGYWVGEPGIDNKASAFIAKFHEARRFEAQAQTMVLPPTNKV